MLIDTHAHLESTDYDSDREEMIARAHVAGVTHWINIADGLEAYEKTKAIVADHPEAFISLGIHPHSAKGVSDEEVERLSQYAKDPKVVAIGETGLDYYYENSPKEDQKRLFTRFLNLAKETGLPLVVHLREAEEDCLKLIDSVFDGPVKGVIHCFTSTKEFAQQCMDRGFHISFSGIITFKKSEALREVVSIVPIDRLLVETDAPFLSPEPFRGKRNEPAFMVKTAEKVAELKQVSFKELACQTTENAKKLFGLNLNL